MEHITTLVQELQTEDDGTTVEEQTEERSVPAPVWCKCGKCQVMPRDIENKCCNKRTCITERRKFTKFCLDPENLEMCIKNVTDLRNDQRDSSTRAFRKAAYRQFILWQHGYLGKGNRQVVPSCAVLTIREHYPSPTGIYMGFKES